MEINVEEIINYSGDVEYIKDAKLSKYSTYGTGGKCALAVLYVLVYFVFGPCYAPFFLKYSA